MCATLFFFPLFFIMTLYLSIFIYLHKRVTNANASGKNESQTNKLSKAKATVLKTLMFLTVLFFLCWVWNTCFILLFTLAVQIPTTGSFYNFSVFLLNINFCVNPFCYAIQYFVSPVFNWKFFTNELTIKSFSYPRVKAILGKIWQHVKL